MYVYTRKKEESEKEEKKEDAEDWTWARENVYNKGKGKKSILLLFEFSLESK